MYPAFQRTKQGKHQVLITDDFSYSPEPKSRSEIFEQMHESQNWFFIEERGWHLPATKDPHDWCGEWSFRGCLNIPGHRNSECQDKVFVKTFQKSCFRADCSTCWKKWLGRESNKSTRRIEKYENQSNKSVKHIIISAPKWLYGKEKKVLAKTAYAVLKEVGAEGGCMIFHPFRYNKQKMYWYYSPHFHVLGFGWVDGATVAEVHSKQGWIIKNKGTRDSTFATLYYILSHAGIKKHSHALTWFGALSYSKLVIEDCDNSSRKCPYCYEKLVEVFSLGPYRVKAPCIDMELIAEPNEWTDDRQGDKMIYAPDPVQ